MDNIGLAKVIPRAQLLREFYGGLDRSKSITYKNNYNLQTSTDILTRFGFLSLSYKTTQK